MVPGGVVPEGEPAVWLQRLALAALAGVIAQGLLGGLTVKLNLPLAVSAAHATLAQLFFLTTVSLAVFTSRSWLEPPVNTSEEGEGIPLRGLCVAALSVIFDSVGAGGDPAALGYLGPATADQPGAGTYFWRADRDRGSFRNRSDRLSSVFRPPLPDQARSGRCVAADAATASGLGGIHHAAWVARRSATAGADDLGYRIACRLRCTGICHDDCVDAKSFPRRTCPTS